MNEHTPMGRKIVPIKPGSTAYYGATRKDLKDLPVGTRASLFNGVMYVADGASAER